MVSSANHRSTRLSQLELVGREVEVEPGVLEQPLLDRRRLVRGVVVQDQVQVQVLRDGGVDELEEPQELLVPVPAVGLADDRAVATS